MRRLVRSRDESYFICRPWEPFSGGNDEVRTFIEQMTPRIDEQFLVETCFLEFLHLTSKKVLQTV